MTNLLEKKYVESWAEKIAENIETDEIRTVIVDMIIKYWTYPIVPSSKSGRYHPHDEFRLWGNGLHINRVTRVIEHLIRMDKGLEHTQRMNPKYDPLTPKDKDILRAAAVIHDLNKVTGDNSADASPLMVLDFFNESLDAKDYNSWGHKIMELVAVHGGFFYPAPRIDGKYMNFNPNDRLHMYMHTADFIASRTDITVDVHKPIDQQNRVDPTHKSRIDSVYNNLIKNKDNKTLTDFN